MEKFDEKDGVWRTIGGRRVFIRTGQSLSDAMRESGKFKTKSGKVKKEDSSKEVKEENIDKEEYELFKKAMENPDSIDPMTENSTDWEALEKKYKDRYEKETKKNISKNNYGGNKALYDLEMSKYSSKDKLERAKEKVKSASISDDERKYYQDYIEKREGKPIKDIINESKNNVIPRDYEKITYTQNIDTNAGKKGDKFEMYKNEYGETSVKNLRTGETFHANMDMMRSSEAVTIDDVVKKGQSTNETMNEAIRSKTNHTIGYQKSFGKDGTVYTQQVKISSEEKKSINDAIEKEIKNDYPNWKEYAGDKWSAKRNLEKLSDGNINDTNLTTNRFIKNHLKDDKIKTDRNTRYATTAEKTSNQTMNDAIREKASKTSKKERIEELRNKFDKEQNIFKRAEISEEINMLQDDFKGTREEYRKQIEKEQEKRLRQYQQEKEKRQKEIRNQLLQDNVKNVKTQKGLKSMADNGLATDITRYDDKQTKALREKHGSLEKVKILKGIYGMNGALLRSRETGEYFVITSRNSNLFYWV